MAGERQPREADAFWASSCGKCSGPAADRPELAPRYFGATAGLSSSAKGKRNWRARAVRVCEDRTSDLSKPNCWTTLLDKPAVAPGGDLTYQLHFISSNTRLTCIQLRMTSAKESRAAFAAGTSTSLLDAASRPPVRHAVTAFRSDMPAFSLQEQPQRIRKDWTDTAIHALSRTSLTSEGDEHGGT